MSTYEIGSDVEPRTGVDAVGPCPCRECGEMFVNERTRNGHEGHCAGDVEYTQKPSGELLDVVEERLQVELDGADRDEVYVRSAVLSSGIDVTTRQVGQCLKYFTTIDGAVDVEAWGSSGNGSTQWRLTPGE